MSEDSKVNEVKSKVDPLKHVRYQVHLLYSQISSKVNYDLETMELVTQYGHLMTKLMVVAYQQEAKKKEGNVDEG